MLPGIGAAQAASLPAAPAAVQEHASPVSIDWAVDGAITGSALALWLGTELAKDSLTPPSCRWCATNQLDVSVRNALVWSNPGSAGTASDIMVVAIPAGIALRDVLAVGSAREAVPDLVIIGEAMAISGFLGQTFKFATARQRPYALYGTQPSAGADDNRSFYSSHTTIAFSAVAAGGMLAQLRGDSAWPWVYGVGFTAAAATGYFRLAADRHWLTDVLMGAASGTAVGLAVPVAASEPVRGAGAARLSRPAGHRRLRRPLGSPVVLHEEVERAGIREELFLSQVELPEPQLAAEGEPWTPGVEEADPHVVLGLRRGRPDGPDVPVRDAHAEGRRRDELPDIEVERCGAGDPVRRERGGALLARREVLHGRGEAQVRGDGPGQASARVERERAGDLEDSRRP